MWSGKRPASIIVVAKGVKVASVVDVVEVVAAVVEVVCTLMDEAHIHRKRVKRVRNHQKVQIVIHPLMRNHHRLMPLR